MLEKSYEYLGHTTSLCEDCLTAVPAKIIIEGDSVYFIKHCSEHGEQKTLISADTSYFRASRNRAALSSAPAKFHTTANLGCPLDCGICEEHERHIAAGIIEVLDECNLHCPTCIAGSFPGAGHVRTPKQIEFMMDTLIDQEGGSLDLLMISGGEPTIHPNILDIIKTATQKPIRRIMLISNGVRIANSKNFATHLGQYRDKLEVYLQFDSLRESTLRDIRGEDLRDIRRKAADNLEASAIDVTLICVVKRGVNDNEIGEVIDFAISRKNIRGVTFQPCKITGRHDTFNFEDNYITLDQTRRLVIESGHFNDIGMIPHPMNPYEVSIGYLLRDTDDNKSVAQVTESLFNSDIYGSEFVRELGNMFYYLPQLDGRAGTIKYDKLFRVAVVSFLDKYNFSTDAARMSFIFFATTDGRVIPIDTYYLLYQGSNDDVNNALPLINPMEL